METNKIVARVKFNDGEAYVFKNPIKLTYYRFGNTIIGTDGIFYTALYRQFDRFAKSFAGRKLTWIMNDGEVIENGGEWWDGISADAKILLPKKLVSVTASSVERLRDCYVYNGYIADAEKLKELQEETQKLPLYEYYDFEHYLKAVKIPKLKSRFNTWLWGMKDTFVGVDNRTYLKKTVHGKILFTAGGMLDDNFKHKNFDPADPKPELIHQF